MIRVDTFASPIGPLTTAERAGRVCLLHFGPDMADLDRMFERWYPGEPRNRQPLPETGAVLTRYFDGDTTAIDTVPVELNGTAFQKNVWAALRRIPCGSTISYAELARRIGEPAAVRAVGAANGANPVAVVVPCHRVIGADGSLTGYGGGLDRKKWLLTHEGVTPPRLW
ncbi:MAG TPA: methylated-DNA--[protein]-cysteine S-methyltransferase [Vicinamibacterales bacterium]|nr:methylated-DNA--[protein]-cysteine S-methyltransferase [Vicinamibacterales bacterium]